MVSRDSRPRKGRKKRLLIIAIAALLLLLALILRSCLGLGLGTGDGTGDDTATDEPQPLVTSSADAGQVVAEPSPDSGSAGPARCALVLDAQGLRIGGRPATIEQAVTACRAAGAADLRVMGDARTGTYKQLQSALEAADISLYEQQ